MYPNGQPWFPTLINYAALYHDLNRGSSILHQTWECFHDITQYKGKIDDTPMTPKNLRAEDLYELSLRFNLGKKENKEVTLPQRYLGRLDDESLIESPNVVMWLGIQLKETFGIGLLQLQREKQANTPLWNRIKSCYMFPGDRTSATYTGELGNKHLREIMTFLGFGPRIVGSTVMHSSLRAGGAQEGGVNVRRGM
jgi:hypothetical protein